MAEKRDREVIVYMARRGTIADTRRGDRIDSKFEVQVEGQEMVDWIRVGYGGRFVISLRFTRPLFVRVARRWTY